MVESVVFVTEEEKYLRGFLAVAGGAGLGSAAQQKGSLP